MMVIARESGRSGIQYPAILVLILVLIQCFGGPDEIGCRLIGCWMLRFRGA
jgi:hypothetical protein